MLRNINNNQKLLIILSFFIFIADIAILINLIFLRQILGFLFLTFLPGLLIIHILKLNKMGFTEKVVLLVGISISFLMFFGLLINTLLLSLGYETPLATISLLISFNVAFITLAIIGYKINKEPLLSLPKFNLSTSEKAFLVVPVLFPALSILGTHLMKTTDNNIILMFLLFLIPTYVVFVCFFNHKFPKRLYPVVIFSISISLLLIFMLRFPHISGHDVHIEYGIPFQTTLDNLHWAIIEHSTLDACLSISLLPTIFQSIMNVNAQEYLFKSVYVSICSFSPLAIYIISKKYVDELYAFLASFFFMSQYTFLIVTGSPRTGVAIFFVALAVMVIFNDKIASLKRRILIIIFILSVVVSHYSSAYIFFFVILITCFASGLFSKMYGLKKAISLTLVLLFFAFIFFWYSQVTEAAFTKGLKFIDRTIMHLNEFFIAESRHEGLQELAAQGMTPHPMVKVRFVSTWATFIFIGIGVLTMLKRYKEMIVISDIKLKKPDFLKTKFEMEYLVMALLCSGLMVAMIVIPYISIGYGIQRLYSLMIVILSVCFVIGGITLSKHFFFFAKHFLSKKRFVLKEKQKSFLKKEALLKKEKQGKNALHNSVRKSVKGRDGSQARAYFIILLVLIPYSMFQTGFIYQIYGPTLPVTLNSEGEEYNAEYIHDSESCAAKWLTGNGEKKYRIDTRDKSGCWRLLSQGKYRSPPRYNPYGYIYLDYNDVKDVVYEGNTNINLDIPIGASKIFDTNCAEIYLVLSQ